MELRQVHSFYDTASHWYDLFTKLVFHRLLGLGRLRQSSLDLLGDLNGARVLDVGCGTGLHFQQIRERIGPRGHLVAVDYSLGMLSKARERVRYHGWGNVSLLQDDAAKLESVEGKFDAIVSFWCLGIVHDLDSAIRECLSRLKPGGSLVIVDFQRSRPERGWMRWLYPVYRQLLIWTKIDTPEDLDDEKLRLKWERALQFLERRLEGIHQESYLYGTGIVVAGKKPSLHPGPGAPLDSFAKT